MSQATLKGSILRIFGLTEDDVTALVPLEGRNGISRTDNRLKARLQNLVNTGIDKKLRSVKFENGLLHTSKDVASSPRYGKRIAEAMLDN